MGRLFLWLESTGSIYYIKYVVRVDGKIKAIIELAQDFFGYAINCHNDWASSFYIGYDHE